MKNTNYHKAKFWVGIKLLSTDSKSYKPRETISVMAGMEDIKESKDFSLYRNSEEFWKVKREGKSGIHLWIYL